MDQLITLLYVSTIASKSDATTTISDIAKEARIRNAKDDVTGLLVFDGDQFVQLVEGPEASMESLWARLQRDPRHTNLKMIFYGRTLAERRFQNWRLGYKTFDSKDEARLLRKLYGPISVQVFMNMLPTMDQDIGDAFPKD